MTTAVSAQNPFKRGNIVTADRFTGTVRSAPVVTDDSVFNYSTSHVTFSPGARTRWHSHDEGQILIGVAGEGWYQERGSKVQRLRPGDVVKILPGAVHWHGATADSEFSHLSQIPHQHDGQTRWFGKVSEAEYAALPDTAAREQRYPEPILLKSQGSFAVGGTVVTDSTGNTLHGDHAYVFWQEPENARRLPLVFVHGTGQFSKTWETTPDGREGFQNIFLRRGFTTYVVDQPRRGRAGRSTQPASVVSRADEQLWFNRFRLGIWPDYFDGVQFARDKESLDQYFRQMAPNTGPFDLNVVSDAMGKLFDRIGDAILVVHSQGGAVGWQTFRKTDRVKAIVAYEPGGEFPFIEGEQPTDAKTPTGVSETIGIDREEFMRYTSVPILIVYGDNLPAMDELPSGYPERDEWTYRLDYARKWAASVNAHGGDVTVIHLPEIGIHGNTHFPFSDLNNMEIADMLSKYLTEKGLDK